MTSHCEQPRASRTRCIRRLEGTSFRRRLRAESDIFIHRSWHSTNLLSSVALRQLERFSHGYPKSRKSSSSEGVDERAELPRQLSQSIYASSQCLSDLRSSALGTLQVTSSLSSPALMVDQSRQKRGEEPGCEDSNPCETQAKYRKIRKFEQIFRLPLSPSCVSVALIANN